MEKGITDKELLAICNLSNLKMEFANLTYEETESKTGYKIVRNHTISSLFEKEKEAILNKKNTKKDRGFFKELGENETEDTINDEKIIYLDIIDLKKSAGIVYEYYEKNNPFTTEWEILYAGDSYKVITDYFDIINKSIIEENNDYKMDYVFEIKNSETLKEEELEVSVIKQKNNFQVYVGNRTLDDISLKNSIIEFAKEHINSIKEIKIKYPTREEVEEIKKHNSRVDLSVKILNGIFLLLPLVIEEFKFIKSSLRGQDKIRLKNIKKIYLLQKQNLGANLKNFFDGKQFTKEMKDILKKDEAELRIGHLTENNEHNDKVYEYVYNVKDNMKKGVKLCFQV